mmetsp:Transcript_16586/g.50932  ORF Transcript_16586/g.50932 Transcript_16586/m.50932 type:complete len:212 (-) Transcript_16586:403-1038(-)
MVVPRTRADLGVIREAIVEARLHDARVHPEVEPSSYAVHAHEVAVKLIGLQLDVVQIHVVELVAGNRAALDPPRLAIVRHLVHVEVHFHGRRVVFVAHIPGRDDQVPRRLRCGNVEPIDVPRVPRGAGRVRILFGLKDVIRHELSDAAGLGARFSFVDFVGDRKPGALRLAAHAQVHRVPLLHVAEIDVELRDAFRDIRVGKRQRGRLQRR